MLRWAFDFLSTTQTRLKAVLMNAVFTLLKFYDFRLTILFADRALRFILWDQILSWQTIIIHIASKTRIIKRIVIYLNCAAKLISLCKCPICLLYL